MRHSTSHFLLSLPIRGICPSPSLRYEIIKCLRALSSQLFQAARNVVPDNMDVPISVGKGLLMPESEGVSQREHIKM